MQYRQQKGLCGRYRTVPVYFSGSVFSDAGSDGRSAGMFVVVALSDPVFSGADSDARFAVVFAVVAFFYESLLSCGRTHGVRTTPGHGGANRCSGHTPFPEIQKMRSLPLPSVCRARNAEPIPKNQTAGSSRKTGPEAGQCAWFSSHSPDGRSGMCRRTARENHSPHQTIQLSFASPLGMKLSLPPVYQNSGQFGRWS